MIVLHYTAMATPEAALERLCDSAAEVSAHYLICPKGRVWHLVDEAARAWHAGAGQWGDVTDVNSRSIGIELANPGEEPFPEPQMAALEDLMAGIMARWAIAPARVIAHSDMAPARKGDPGPRFDWRRLSGQGTGPRLRNSPAMPRDLAMSGPRVSATPTSCAPFACALARMSRGHWTRRIAR